MNELSKPAQLFIGTVIAIGAVLILWQSAYLDLSRPVVLGIMCSAATLLQIIKIEGSTTRTSYNFSWVIYGAAFTLLGAPAALLTILVAHSGEWIWRRYPWYIQSFNIASFAITTAAAGIVYVTVEWLPADVYGIRDTGALLAALITFTFVNHLLVGLVIKWARGQNLQQSGVFQLTTLTIDLGLLCLGAGAVYISRVNPAAVILMVIVSYLLQSALRVPALQRKNETEPKTGLYNAQYFEQTLQRELDRAQKQRHPLAMAMADLDRLRDINNTYGHLAGDAVIKKVAQILQASARDSDVVARFGGEEFAILMPNLEEADALVQIEAMRKAIEAAEFSIPTNPKPIKITMSFGIAGTRDQLWTAEEFVHYADLAVYGAKFAGRNRVCVYSEGSSAMNRQNHASSEPDLTSNRQDSTTVPVADNAAIPALPAEPSPQTVTPPPSRVLPEVSPAPSQLPPSSRYVNYLVAAVAVSAVGLTVLLMRPFLAFDWTGLLVFALVALALEIAATDIYTSDTSVSTSVAPLLAATLAFGVIGAVVISLLIPLVSYVKHRTPLNRPIFNVSNHLIGSLLCLLPLELARATLPAWPEGAQILYFLLCAAIIYLVTTGLVAAAVSLNRGRRFAEVWGERFRWLGIHYVALGLVAYVLYFCYVSLGSFSVILLLIPLAMIHLSQRQYIKATQGMVDQLRNTNSELVRQSDQVRRLNEELLHAVAATIDLRDPYVVEHSRHVARYAAMTAVALDLPPTAVELIYQAGLMHDIGKLAIPEAILFKPGRLTDEEYEVIKDHVLIGADLLDDFQSLQRIALYVRYHHERYDGRGYPDGLSGETIPIEARILALADAVEAMASDRPYRQGSSPEAILQELTAQSGKQFDPQVVDAFVRLVAEKGPSMITNSARAMHQPDEDHRNAVRNGLMSWVTGTDLAVSEANHG